MTVSICEHGNATYWYQAELYGCDHCSYNEYLRREAEDNDWHGEPYEYILQCDFENMVEKKYRKFVSIVEDAYEFYAHELEMSSADPVLYHTARLMEVLWNDDALERELINQAVMKCYIKRHFKSQITEELIAEVMHPMRLQKKMEAFNGDMELFFEAI